MRIFLALFFLTTAHGFQQRTAVIKDLTHRSQVMEGTRAYRVYLPPAYSPASQKRYAVVYWFHGYDPENDARDAALATYVGGHDLIVVDSGPVETSGTFPLYFPELAEQVDRSFRTAADRDHRGISGNGVAGFYTLWQASKCPDLVGSASATSPTPEEMVGPRGFDVESALDEIYFTLDAVKIRRAAASATIAETLDFHMQAFAHPLPKPTSFSHIDPYPNFGVWNWEVVSDRRWPAFTVLENVSKTGFRSAVREWIPGGAPMANVKLSITSPRLYAPGIAYPVVYIRPRDGYIRKASQKADGQGRLTFDVDGELWEVGIGAAPVLALSGYELTDAHWATAGKPVTLRLKFWNKGGARSITSILKWESSTPGVKISAPPRLYGLAPGESAAVNITCTFERPSAAGARITLNDGAVPLSLDIPVFPPAEAAADYRIADGRVVAPYDRPFGEGNRDGHAGPGETFAILLPDAGSWKAAELFTNDSCIDNTARVTDNGARISLPTIKASCEPGRRISFLARVGLQYFTVELPVWYRD